MDKQLRDLASELGHQRAASDIVADAIRHLISAGKLQPGERLPPERQLAPMLGAARVTIRAAIRTLNEEGLLRTGRGRSGGTMVCHRAGTADANSLEAFKTALAEFYEFRRVIEPTAAQLAAERGSESERRALLRLCEQAPGSRLGFRDLDTRFHLLIARMSRNPHILEAVEQNRGAFVVLVNSLLLKMDGDDAAGFAAEHQRIAQAIHRGDSAAARREMSAHFRRAHGQFLDALSRAPALRSAGAEPGKSKRQGGNSRPR
jgi:GntR family transcriptional regulator, transcriptional repressor for pyruvate dehydrogenase complex